MESLSGTVEGLLQGSGSLECTPTLSELISPKAQEILESGFEWRDWMMHFSQEDEGKAPIQDDDYMTFANAEAPNVLLDGSTLRMDSEMEALLNRTEWEQAEQPVKQEDPAAAPYGGPPATNVYEGEYGFDVRCPNKAKATKSVAYTFAEHSRKLYCNMNTACPFYIYLEKPPPPGAVVRVMAVYAELEDRMQVIKRCVVHATPENNKGDMLALASHFVRCDNSKAEYHKDPASKHHSLTIPYEEPQAGLKYVVCLLRFMCLSTCNSVHRRPIKLIWTLEHNGRALGRQAIGLKVCTCPGRDRNSEESKAVKRRGCGILDPALPVEPAGCHADATTSGSRSVRRKRALVEARGGPSKSRKSEPDEERSYYIECSSPEIRDLLKLIRDSLVTLKEHKPAVYWAHYKKLTSHDRGATVKQEPGDTVSSGESQE